MAWKVLVRYYVRLEESNLYTSAILLNPSTKSWLVDVWRSREQRVWLARAQTSLRNHWQEYYASNNTSNNTSTPSPVPLSSTPVDEGALGIFGRHDVAHAHSPSEGLLREYITTTQRATATEALDELDRWEKMPQLPGDINPIEWWLNNRQDYPTLSLFALDLLAARPMAADCERAFSQAKLSQPSQRLRMSIDTLEAVESLKQWIRAGAWTVGGLEWPAKTW